MKKMRLPIPFLFLLPSLLGICVFVLIPFADVIGRSFRAGISGKFCGFSNYIAIWHNGAFLLAVKNTLRFTAVCLPLLIGLGLIIALQISGMEKIQIFKTLFLFPMAVPIATVALLWKLMFCKAGLWNLFLSKLLQGLCRLGIWEAESAGAWYLLADASGAPDYMNSEKAFWVLTATYIWKNLGYTIVLWLAGIRGISGEIMEAARVDGAGRAACFFRILLPNLKGTFYTITVLSFANSFKVFREAYLVAGTYPDKSIYLLQHLFNNWFLKMELDKMAAAAVCVGLVLLLAILLLQRIWEEN